METRLGTASEAAQVLDIKVETFRKRHARDRLPFEPVMRLGGYLVWDLDEVARHRDAEAGR